MSENNDILLVGKYNQRFNEILNIDYKELNIYRSKGLPAHMVKRKHYNCLKYVDYISDIITSPDYIGINPNEPEKSLELIKCYKDNVMIGIKLDSNGQYYYVSTMFDIQKSKIDRRLHSGRIKKFSRE
nr:PBECR2 nuclease fold domain-containing protein [uncultured Blautia sp.]